MTILGINIQSVQRGPSCERAFYLLFLVFFITGKIQAQTPSSAPQHDFFRVSLGNEFTHPVSGRYCFLSRQSRTMRMMLTST